MWILATCTSFISNCLNVGTSNRGNWTGLCIPLTNMVEQELTFTFIAWIKLTLIMVCGSTPYVQNSLYVYISLFTSTKWMLDYTATRHSHLTAHSIAFRIQALHTSTSHPTVFLNPPMHTTNKHKAYIVGKMAQDVGMVWKCCGTISILFGWFLRVPSLHVLVFVQKIRLRLVLLLWFYGGWHLPSTNLGIIIVMCLG